MIKLKHLLREDEDQNNNGYPDKTERAVSKEHWWSLVRADLAKWNAKAHPEDRLSIQDYIGEIGPMIYGWRVSRDSYGDWDIE